MTKKVVKFLIVLILLMIAYFVLFKHFRIQDNILRQIYPTKFSEYVEEYSEQNNIDKYMIYAIIKAESNFNPNVKSQSDARGLMQLMEDTAIERLSVIENRNEVTKINLYDPETNIKLGTSYYAYLLKYYKGNTVLALTAYNAGIGNVDNWIKGEIIKKDGSDPENIPYKETNNYVRKILKSYQMYIKLYYQ